MAKIKRRMNMKAYLIKDCRIRYHLINKLAANLLFLLLYLSGCTSLLRFPAYYDPVTYKNLTDLKPEVITLYDTFVGDFINTDKIAISRLRLAQIYEYEVGKGEKNIETTRQIKIIQEMFERHINDRLENGKWNEIHLNNQKENIAKAFDIAIETERLKNKNE